MLALVLPGKVASPPHVRETGTPTSLRDGLLEGVRLTRRIGFDGRRLAKQPTEIDEMLSGSSALGSLRS